MRITFPDQFNMATYYLDDRIKEGRGDRVAVYYEDRQYTYREVQQMTNQVGNVLLKLDVEMEDRVLMVLPDSIEFVATWFAIAKVGAVITMVNSSLVTAEQVVKIRLVLHGCGEPSYYTAGLSPGLAHAARAAPWRVCGYDVQ